MKIRYTFLGGLLMSLLIPALPAQAAVQFDMTDVFNADVIVNGTSGDIDQTQSPVDNATYSLATQGALVDCPDPIVQDNWQGLPNDGFFASNQDHPNVQLAYRNSKNGKNAARLEADDKVSFPVPHDKYRRIHLFATSGDDASSVKVTFKYMDDSTTVKNFTIADWFEDPATGTYALKDHMDRMEPDGATCDESGHETVDAAVFGKGMTPNDNKTLKRMAVKKIPGAGHSILNVFGATGKKA
jgi:hypothetical protein